MPKCRGLFIPRGTRSSDDEPRICFEKLSQLKIASTDGRKFERNDELLEFFENCKCDCLMALLFNTTQKRLGNLRGPRPPECDPLKAASPPVVSASSRPPRPTAEPSVG